MTGPNAEIVHMGPVRPTWWQRVVQRRTVRCTCGWSGHFFYVHQTAAIDLARQRTRPD